MNLRPFIYIGGFLWVAVLVLLAAWMRSRRRRRTVERMAVVRRQTLARFYAGIAARHPEQPGPAGRLELARHGGFYDFVRDQLADADSSNESREQT